MKKIIFWLPRILAIALTLFFAVFILEGFGSGFSWQDSLMHLIPTLIVGGITVVSWNFPRLGGWFFVILAISFAFFFQPFIWNGMFFAIAPLVIGVLFLVERKLD